MRTYAVPVKAEWQTFVQPDGTVITLLPVGDEYLHYFITSDSIPVIISADNKTACYAKVHEGKLISTGIAAHEKDTRTQNDLLAIAYKPDNEQINTVWRHKRDRLQSKRIVSSQQKRSAGGVSGKALAFGDRTPTLGNKRGLIILVDFPNATFTAEHDHAFYDAMINKEGYTDEQGHIGSVHDYFCDQSYGQFTPTFDIIGPVRLKHDYAYYGADGNEDIDLLIYELIIEACSAVDDEVDFSQYDWNGDGEVDQVFFIYAGKGESTNPSITDLIWPHMNSLEDLTGAKFFFDGVEVNTYACCNEVYGAKNTAMGIGTICHEFSHCLGLPDTYDTVLGTVSALGVPASFDLMSSGNYNGPHGRGEVPASLTAYGKYLAGWLEYKELGESQNVDNMAPSILNNDAYIIYNNACKDEYYVLENRQKISWDAYIPSSGLTILHIDFDKKAWNENLINAEKVKRMVYVASVSGYSPKYTFPYGTVNAVTEKSLDLHNPNTDGTHQLRKSVTDIVQNSDRTVSFHFEDNNPTSVITDIHKESAGMIKYYNLNGIFVGNAVPEKSGIYIAKGFYDTHKIIVK